MGVVFSFSPSLYSFWSYFSTDLQQHIGHLLTWGVHLSVSYLFAFSYCSWGSQGKNSEVVCHSLLQWATFFQISPPRPDHLGWPHTEWLSFMELDKAVVLWSIWLVFCDCGFSLSPLDALSHSYILHDIDASFFLLFFVFFLISQLLKGVLAVSCLGYHNTFVYKLLC